MSKIFFITGTDTEVGKTYVSTGILHVANSRQLRTIGLKPVSSGCLVKDGNLYNEDAELLQRTASCQLAYKEVNPFPYLPAIAPHIAAEQRSSTLDVTSLIHHTQPALQKPHDVCIIEGFGGWHAPLNANETMADFVSELSCTVIMVVGVRLGCINHAILTERAIKASGVICAGWIANMIDPDMPCKNENIASLQNWMRTPLLALVSHNEPAMKALENLTVF